MAINEIYIKPRKKLPEETKEYELLRRTEENIEFYYACGRMSHVGYLEDMMEYIGQREKEMEESEAKVYSKHFPNNILDSDEVCFVSWADYNKLAKKLKEE